MGRSVFFLFEYQGFKCQEPRDPKYETNKFRTSLNASNHGYDLGIPFNVFFALPQIIIRLKYSVFKTPQIFLSHTVLTTENNLFLATQATGKQSFNFKSNIGDDNRLDYSLMFQFRAFTRGGGGI